MTGRARLRASARRPVDASAPSPAPAPRAAGSAAAERRALAAERAREVEDSPRVLREKCRRLARALRNAKHLVVYTGAGISTAADIPDYRGPRGVWTRLQRGERVGRVEVSRAEPTFTHMALTALWARGALKFVVSQNCDGLHVRAGLPRRALAELHGDMFAELCAPCRRLYLRAFDTTERTARHRHTTRRLCHACGAELRDSIVHFGERGRAAWPLNWAGALRHAARADVVLCLGSSLKVLRRYSPLWRMHSAPAARPALYIVNLQWTPKDSAAALKINARCDAVMRQVARRLRLRVPRYRRARDPLLAHAEPLAPAEAHTTARRALSTPPSHRSLAFSPASSTTEEPSSPSASDSDEEVPLRRLADRLRPPPSHHHHRPHAQPTRLRAFQVNLACGETTILLRAEDAPSSSPPRARSPPRSSTSELRRFRMKRRPPEPTLPRADVPNGGGPRLDPGDGSVPLTPGPGLNGWSERLNGVEIKPNPVLFMEPKKEKDEAEEKPVTNGTVGSRLRQLLERESRAGPDARQPPFLETKLELKEEADEGAGSLAAAIIARAVLLCRASLYPGLHTIIAPPPPAAPAPGAAPAAAPGAGAAGGGVAECAWCWRHHSSRRCLWYGPPRHTPLAARAWRRVRGRRYLCACCAGDSEPSPAAAAAGAAADVGEGGWYGKGYRKGRRRRR